MRRTRFPEHRRRPASLALECTGCGLRAFVGGGFSVGMVGATLTVWCGVCEALQDAGLDGYAWDLNDAFAKDPKTVQETARCDEDIAHAVTPWKRARRCGAEVRETGETQDWD